MKINKIVFLIIVFLIYTINAQAQFFPDDPGGDPGLEEIPIDGGLSVLLAAGIGIVAKKMRNR